MEIMKKMTASEPSIKGSCLNVCFLQSMMSLCKGESVKFCMTLLAYAADMGRTEMVKFLIHAGAGNASALKLITVALRYIIVLSMTSRSESPDIDLNSIDYRSSFLSDRRKHRP